MKKWCQSSWQGVYVGSLLLHAQNVPLIYNPVTTHTTLQFHDVFDNSFTTVNGDPSLKTNESYNALYQRDRWDYSDRFAQIKDLYTFDTFWQDSPLSPAPPGRGRKRKTPTPSQPSMSTTNHHPSTTTSSQPSQRNSGAVAQEDAMPSGSAQDALKDRPLAKRRIMAP